MNENVMCCAVCKKSRNYGSKNSFYRFPKDSKSLKLWMGILGSDTNTISNNASICSDHFLAHHFRKAPDGTKHLSTTALPIIPFQSKLDQEIQLSLEANKNPDVAEKSNSDQTASIDCDTKDEEFRIARNRRKSRGQPSPDIFYSLDKRFWKAAKNVILRQRRKIKSLHDVLRHLESSVDTMNSSVKQLEDNLLKSSCIGVYLS